MKYNKKNILIIAAHPDDEVLGCGGSIAKWVNKGHNVFNLIMAEVATSRDNERNQNSRRKDLKHLKKCAEQSGKLLGVKSVSLIDFPDNRMDSIDFLDVIKPIEKIIKKLNKK